MKIKTVIIVLVVCVILTSCTVQTQFDVYDFCTRFNRIADEKILLTADFLSDNDGGLYCFFIVGESRILITLNESENSSIESIFLTVSKEQYNETDRDEIINAVYCFFGAFNYGDAEKARELLLSVGFDGDFMPFYDEYESETDERYKITLYSNAYSFTVSQEKIDSYEL